MAAAHLQTLGLTGVGVQTEATGSVARLDPVGHSAVFSFVFISSHHVQNDKPDDEEKLVSNLDSQNQSGGRSDAHPTG